MSSNRFSFVTSDKLANRIEEKAEALSLGKSEIIRRSIAEDLLGEERRYE